MILGVKVDRVTLPQALKIVDLWLISDRSKHYITTPNPEMIVAAQKDPDFKRILNAADLAIPDGAGLRLADPKLRRLSGADLMMALIKKGYKTLLCGSKPGVAQKAAKKLGVMGISQPNLSKINKIKPDLLFVALGHGKQEKWIAKNLPKLKVKVAMGVGGSLDYIAKPWLRAPLLIQTLGLEWLWRLILQPWRLKRQLSLLEFVYLVITNKW
ncbi:MAG TPA: WecB/TagA/CpsF family glycosyltransferase [Patescibacteria group bacterium]|nr:WecB/TagA/CpsF family glycosyltransferase [Patescibacteria group bacterium]